MAVVQFKVALEPRQTLLTMFVVRCYWQDRTGLHEGKGMQFPCMERALRAGKAAADRWAFVQVSRIRGNPDVDYWEEPVTVAKYGSVPDLSVE